MSANISRKGVSVMRKLPFAFLALPLLIAGAAQAAPPAGLLCGHEAVPNAKLGDYQDDKKKPQEPEEPDAKLLAGNCFYDDVYLLSGDEMVLNPKTNMMVPLVTCPAATGKKPTFGDC